MMSPVGSYRPGVKFVQTAFGEAADIAVSDTWPGGSPTEESAETDLGTNAAIVRSQRGEELILSAIEAGYLTRSANLSLDDLNRFQPHQEAKKRAAYARLKGLRAAGQLVPSTHQLRLKKLAKTNSEKFNQREYEGALQRARSGKFEVTHET